MRKTDRCSAPEAVSGKLRNRAAASLRRLLQNETAVTSLEYLVAALAVVLGAVVASRTLGNALIDYLHRIYLVVTLPIP